MTPLPHENLLTALGEVAAAFVGFSLVVVLRARSASSAKETRRLYSMRDVAEIGLVAVGASFLPLVIHTYGAGPETTWRLASAGVLALLSLGLGSSMWRRRTVTLDGFQTEPIQTAIVLVLNVCGMGLLSINILVGGSTSGARYTTAVLLSLALAGVLFVNATFSNSANRPAA